MDRLEPDLPLVRWIESEHASLVKHVAAVEAELARVSTATVREMRSLARVLATFDKYMRRHFAFEEEGGPLDELGRDRAEAQRVADICDQHGRLQSALTRLRMELAQPTTPSKALIVHGVREFLRDLRVHEVEEQAAFEKLKPH